MPIFNASYDAENFFDEMLAADGAVRPHYRRLAERLGNLPESEFNQ
ncbi:MAG TPA: hypothetical protein VNR00_01225 [Opitutus sp.]|nr:hypothetical protein [Opitutus sp.]